MDKLSYALGLLFISCKFMFFLIENKRTIQ